MNTTLNQIRDESPCADGWKKLLAHLGKTQADDEALSIITILDSNGLDDALWCLRAVKGHDREIRLYAAWCARQVQHLMTDKRSLDALDVAERYANGLANKKELAAASFAAWAAARAAWSAADGADAAWSAADAAWSAASNAASDAASDAARAGARSANGANGARSAADAAWSAAWAANGSSAARSAANGANGARSAANGADAADAASDAARAAQEKRLREDCAEIDAALAPQKEQDK